MKQKKHNEEALVFGKEALTHAANDAFKRGLTSSSPATVLSLRLPTDNQILMTPAHISFEQLTGDDLFVLPIDGAVQEAADQSQLPADLVSYLKCFQDRGDISSLGHFHPPYLYRYAAKAPLFELLSKLPISKSGELLNVECKECPSRFTGLCSCRTDITRHYSGAKILLLKDNGILTMAQDLNAVIDMADDIEQKMRNLMLQETQPQS